MARRVTHEQLREECMKQGSEKDRLMIGEYHDERRNSPGVRQGIRACLVE